MKNKFAMLLRVISLIAVIACLLTCAIACDHEDDDDDDSSKKSKTVTKINGKTADEIYADAKAFINKCDVYTLDGTIIENVSYEGEKAVYTLKQYQVYDKGNVYCKTSSDDEVFAGSCFEYWGTDTTIYEKIPSTNQNVRINMSTKEFMQSQGMDNYTDNLLIDLDSSFFSKAEINKMSDGKYEIRCNMNVEKYFDTLSKSSLGTMISSLGADAFKKLTYIVIVDKDGTFCGVNVDGDVETQGIKIKLTSENIFIAGKSEMPSIPADADTWTDYTEYFKK